MNLREKKIAILAFEKGVEHEREKREFEKEHFKRESDSPMGTALTWGLKMEANYDWDKFEGQLS